MDVRHVSRAAAIALAAWILLAGQFAQAQNVYVEPFITLLKSSHAVPQGKYQPFELTLGSASLLEVDTFTEAGLERQLVVRLTDGPNFEKLKRGQGFNAFVAKSSAVATPSSHQISRYEFSIAQSDRYYLVLDNRAGGLFAQKVHILAYAVPPSPTEGSRATEGFLQRTYNSMKKNFVFDDFQIEFRRCGIVNAWSNPNVTLCLELAQDTAGEKLPGALTFLLFHEFGHSFLRLWGDARWRDEDIADQVATALIIMGGRPEMALEAAQWFRKQDSFSAALSQLFHPDPHPVPIQRAKNIENWVGQSQRFARAWHGYFIPHVRTEALKIVEANPKPWADIEKVRAELSRR